MTPVTYDIHSGILVAKVNGIWPPGSQGSWIAKEIIAKIQVTKGCTGFLLDLSSTHYTGGDGPSVVVIQAVYCGMKASIQVGENSRKSIASLVDVCGLGQLGITITLKLV
jgi:hypothetical protein